VIVYLGVKTVKTERKLTAFVGEKLKERGKDDDGGAFEGGRDIEENYSKSEKKKQAKKRERK